MTYTAHHLAHCIDPVRRALIKAVFDTGDALDAYYDGAIVSHTTEWDVTSAYDQAKLAVTNYDARMILTMYLFRVTDVYGAMFYVYANDQLAALGSVAHSLTIKLVSEQLVIPVVTP